MNFSTLFTLLLLAWSNGVEGASKLTGVCYGPYRDNEAPAFYPTVEEIREDIHFIKNLTNSIRIYNIDCSLSEIPHICEADSLDCYIGIEISGARKINRMKIQRLIELANENLSCVKGLIVGNEVLLLEHLSYLGDAAEDTLIEYIKQVKEGTELPVTTAESWQVWLDHPELVKHVDSILVHVHPYWESIPADSAANYVIERWRIVKDSFPDKEVFIGETGWPSEGDPFGDAIPSEANQKIFLDTFKRLTEEEGIQYFYFEAFDEKYKVTSEGEVGAHWGIYYSDGSIKPLLKDLVPEDAQEGIDRPARDRKVAMPWYVYKDALSCENHFIPSGWMGGFAWWQGDPEQIFDQVCSDNLPPRDTCIRIYMPDTLTWAGVYWQYPANNWGDLPGYDLSEANYLIFWARGEKGGEKAEFKAGGINDPEKPYHDSFEASTGVITLTEEWKKYVIDLREENLDTVIGAFCWIDTGLNPPGCTIYLDEIRYDVDTTNSIHESETSITSPLPHVDILLPIGSEIVLRFQGMLEGLHASVFNAAGQKVDEFHSAQTDGTVEWGDGFSQGVYFIVPETQGAVRAQKVVLIR